MKMIKIYHILTCIRGRVPTNAGLRGWVCVQSLFTPITRAICYLVFVLFLVARPSANEWRGLFDPGCYGSTRTRDY